MGVGGVSKPSSARAGLLTPPSCSVKAFSVECPLASFRLPFFSIFDRLTFDLYFEMRLSFGHLMFAWRDSNRSFGFVSLHRRAVLSFEAATAGLRRAFLFLSRTLVSYRRTSLFFVSGTPTYDFRSAFLTFYEDALSALGHGYGLRWIGGMLTNFTSLARTLWQRLGPALRQYRNPPQRDLLFATARGIRFLDRFPDVVCMLSVAGVYRAALRETVLLRLPTIAFVDTDATSFGVTYPIPANDDSFSGASVKLALFKELVTRAMKRFLFADVESFSPFDAVPHELSRRVQESAALDLAEGVRDNLVARGARPSGPLAAFAEGWTSCPSVRSLLVDRYPQRHPSVDAGATKRGRVRLGGLARALVQLVRSRCLVGFRDAPVGVPSSAPVSPGPAGWAEHAPVAAPGNGLLPPPCRGRLELAWRAYRRGVEALKSRVRQTRACLLARHKTRKFLQARLTRQLSAWPWAPELLARRFRGRGRFRYPSSSLILGRLTFNQRFFRFPPQLAGHRYAPFYHERFSTRAGWRFALSSFFPHVLVGRSPSRRRRLRRPRASTPRSLGRRGGGAPPASRVA